jgi:hypothetical protein
MRIIHYWPVITTPVFHFLALQLQIKITYTKSVFFIRTLTENYFVTIVTEIYQTSHRRTT